MVLAILVLELVSSLAIKYAVTLTPAGHNVYHGSDVNAWEV